jgi:hypothetical protein
MKKHGRFSSAGMVMNKGASASHPRRGFSGSRHDAVTTSYQNAEGNSPESAIFCYIVRYHRHSRFRVIENNQRAGRIGERSFDALVNSLTGLSDLANFAESWAPIDSGSDHRDRGGVAASRLLRTGAL